MATITANTGSNNWNTNGAWVGGAQPGATSDVIIPATAVVTIPSAVTALARSVTVSLSGTLAFAATTSVLTIGDATAGAGNVAFSNAGTITLTAIGTINFVSTSTTQQTVTTGGQTMPNMTFNGSGGKWQFSDNCTFTGANMTQTNGTVDYNGKTFSGSTWNANQIGTRTVTLGASTWTLTGTTTAWNIQNTTNLTVTANSASITCNGSATTVNCTDFNMNGASLILTGATFPILKSGGTWANVTRTGTASTIDGFTVSTNGFTVTSTLTLNSQSSINRILVNTDVAGTPRTITANTLVCTNVINFRDITGAGAATWTTGASGATYFGDCLGNSGITTTTPATQTATGTASFSWSTHGWTSRVPLPQDDVVINNSFVAGRIITADMQDLGRNIDFTGVSGGVTWQLPNAGNPNIYGSLTLAAGVTAFIDGNRSLNFIGRSSTHTITSAGLTFSNATSARGTSFGISGAAYTGAKYTLQDTARFGGHLIPTLQNSSGVTVAPGTELDTNSQTVYADVVTLNASALLTLGSSTVNISTGWTVNGGTLSAASSTIAFDLAYNGTRTFAGGGKTYGTITYTVASSPGSLSITGANTFGTLNVGSGRVLQFPTQAMNTITTWNVNGVVNGYVYLPAASGNYISAPDSTALSITGDLTIDCWVAPPDWTPTAACYFVTKLLVGSQQSYGLGLNTDGTIRTFLSASPGTSGVAYASTVATGFSDGTAHWLRMSWVASTHTLQFYTSPDTSTWTKLGADVNTSMTSLFDSTQQLEIGSYNSGTAAQSSGNFYRVRIYNAAKGTTESTANLQFDADFTAASIVGNNTFTESSSNAATVTLNGAMAIAGTGCVNLISSSGGTRATIAGPFNDAYSNTWKIGTTTGLITAAADNTGLPGTTNSYIYTPDSVALSITGDIDIRVRLALTSWAAANQAIAGKYFATGTNASWTLFTGTLNSNKIDLGIVDSGQVSGTSTSSTGVSFTAGQVGWIRATFRASDGRVQFFTAADNPSMPSSWTQLGTDQTNSRRSIYDSTATVEVGSINGGISGGGTGLVNPAGNFYRIQIRNNILDDGTGIVADQSFGWSDIVSSDYLRIQDSAAVGVHHWYAGTHSVSVSGNTGWVFTGPPSNNYRMLMGVGN